MMERGGGGGEKKKKFLRKILFKITPGLKHYPGYVFSPKKRKNDIDMALKPIGIKLKQVPSKCVMRYISAKKKKNVWHYG